MTITIQAVEDDTVCFTEGVMHDEHNGINVSQSLRGDKIFITYRGKKYRVDVSEIAEAVVVQAKA